MKDQIVLFPIYLKIALIAAVMPASLFLLIVVVQIAGGLIMLSLKRCDGFFSCSAGYIPFVWDLKVIGLLLLSWVAFFCLLFWGFYKKPNN